MRLQFHSQRGRLSQRQVERILRGGLTSQWGTSFFTWPELELYAQRFAQKAKHAETDVEAAGSHAPGHPCAGNAELVLINTAGALTKLGPFHSR